MKAALDADTEGFLQRVIQQADRREHAQAFQSPGLGLHAVALVGALVGFIGQEVRRRDSVPQGQLAQGERAFQAGDN